MTTTYIALATTTLSSATSTVTFSSIPATYRDLIIVVGNAQSASGNPGLVARFNGDTNSNYSYVRMTGNGSTTGSASATDTFAVLAAAFGLSTSQIATTITQIMDYSATDKHKTYLSRSSRADAGVEAGAGRWANTNAITSVAVFLGGSLNFAAGTTFSLYGVN